MCADSAGAVCVPAFRREATLYPDQAGGLDLLWHLWLLQAHSGTPSSPASTYTLAYYWRTACSPYLLASSLFNSSALWHNWCKTALDSHDKMAIWLNYSISGQSHFARIMS